MKKLLFILFSVFVFNSVVFGKTSTGSVIADTFLDFFFLLESHPNNYIIGGDRSSVRTNVFIAEFDSPVNAESFVRLLGNDGVVDEDDNYDFVSLNSKYSIDKKSVLVTVVTKLRSAKVSKEKTEFNSRKFLSYIHVLGSGSVDNDIYTFITEDFHEYTKRLIQNHLILEAVGLKDVSSMTHSFQFDFKPGQLNLDTVDFLINYINPSYEGVNIKNKKILVSEDKKTLAVSFETEIIDNSMDMDWFISNFPDELETDGGDSSNYDSYDNPYDDPNYELQKQFLKMMFGL